MPTPNNRSRSGRLSGYNTNNSNINYSTTNIVEQMKMSIYDKNLTLLKILLRRASRDDVKRTWQQNVFGPYERDTARRVFSREFGRFDNLNILHIAASLGFTSMVRAILDSKPSLLNSKTSKGLTALHLALLLNNYKTAKYLVEKKANLKCTLPLVAISAIDGSIDMANFLIRHGAKVNEKIGRTEATPIFFACNRDMLQFLKSKGANVNQKDIYGWTPLMSLAGMVHVTDDYLTDYTVDMMKKLVTLGANISLRGRNREPREHEKKITMLHAAAHGLGDRTPVEMINLYGFIYDEFIRNEKSIKPKTTLGNTPILYLIKQFKRRQNENNLSQNQKNRMIPDFVRVFEMNIAAMSAQGLMPNDTNSDGKNIQYHLRSLTNTVNFPSNFASTYIGNGPIRRVSNNIHIPNNLNRTDPISINAVNINNAYIIKKDLLNKTINKNGRRVRVKEVKTVYNKSSLNGMVATGRYLVSPITRRPFTAQDIVKLSTVASANEMTRYKNSNRR